MQPVTQNDTRINDSRQCYTFQNLLGFIYSFAKIASKMLVPSWSEILFLGRFTRSIFFGSNYPSGIVSAHRNVDSRHELLSISVISSSKNWIV